MMWISCRVLQVETSCSRKAIKLRWYAARLSCPAPYQSSRPARHTTTECHCDGIRNRGAPVGPVTEEAPDPNDPALEWPFSRPRKTQPHAAAEPGTSRSRRQPCFQNPDRRSPCSVPTDGDGHRLESERAAPCPC